MCSCMDCVYCVPQVEDVHGECGPGAGPLCGLEAAYDMLKSFPDGYGIQVEHGSLSVTWRGTPALSFSFWVPQRQLEGRR